MCLMTKDDEFETHELEQSNAWLSFTPVSNRNAISIALNFPTSSVGV